MSTVAGRKKSIIGAGGVQIEQPVANNSLLNKTANVSLYQKCSALRTELLRIKNFAEYFALASHAASSRESTDPVNQLWDCLALGVPLCHLYNLLPPPNMPIPIETDPERLDVSDNKMKKRAIALFSMQIRQIAPQCQQFTVTDLFGDRASTDGFVKVVETVTTLVDRLPPTVRTVSPSSPPPSVSTNASSDSLAAADVPVHAELTSQERHRTQAVLEMVNTERKYVSDLENMQKYANTIVQTIDQDTIHHLFPNLNKLLNFQRRVLIRFEGIAELPWPEQRWALPFLDMEEDFAVYEPYCANYGHACDLATVEEHNLAPYNDIMNAKYELRGFLIKPVQRVCRYPMLLEALLKNSTPENYPHYDELKAGFAAAQRIAERINEGQRRAENQVTVRALEQRVEDWKGHHLSNFGDLLLDDVFVVTKSDVDREYHVFLFEKIILCCKEVYQPPPSARKVGKSNSILKKQSAPSPLPGGGNSAQQKKDNVAPLLLKGRIFLTNVTQAVPSKGTGATPYNLAVWWSGEEDLEFFTLRCRSDEQLKQWETQINRLIKEIAGRRASERNSSFAKAQNSTNPSPQLRTPSTSYDHQKTYSTASSYGRGAFPSGSSTGRSFRQSNPYGDESAAGFPQSVYSNGVGPAGYPGHDGFDLEGDDDYEDYPPAINSPPSGRGTPMSMRRGNSRTPVAWEDDHRQSAYSSMSPSVPSPPTGYASPPNGFAAGPMSRSMSRPSISRAPSTASGASYGSEASFGPGVARPALKSQFSSTRLKTTYENDARVSLPAVATHGKNAHGASRTRSASQPSAYVPKSVPPPLPTGPWVDRTQPVVQTHKRGSGSSQSTAGSSEYSPHTSSSPITPYGSSDSSLGGFDSIVKVKVHFHEDIFVIQVPVRLEYDDLVEKVGRKIRLCGPRRDDGPLRVKYRDEDGDMVSLGSTEDVQMAFESLRGGQVTLWVT